METTLVSFVVAAYNQEAFVREAIMGALSQAYSPLEVILSDDCSRDRTFEIIQELAATYKGPHVVRINRNETNLGIGAHFNRMMQLCNGKLVVLAAGDDISLPGRTETIVQAWNDSGRKATSLSSTYIAIDAGGRPLPGTMGHWHSVGGGKSWVHQSGTTAGFLRRRSPHAAGCAHAISRELFTRFDPLPQNVTYEDTVLSFRTVLTGGLFTFINAPLVKYRRHGNNITFDLDCVYRRSSRRFSDVQEKRRIELERMIAVYQSFSADTKRAQQHGLISAEESAAVERGVRVEGRRLELMRGLLLRPLPIRWAIFCRLYYNTFRPRELLTQLPQVLPRCLYKTGLQVLNPGRGCQI